MGRRPNPVILQYFDRGAKIKDHSNRYQHTCKACGEHFPKGRIDSLTGHLVRRCPAINEGDRIKACLALNGVGNTSQTTQRATAQRNAAPPTDMALVQQRDWTALETLAEVSRQIDLSEKHDDRGGPSVNGAADGTQQPGGPVSVEHFEVQEQFTLDNPPSMYSIPMSKDKHLSDELPQLSATELSTEEQLRAILATATTSPPESTNLSVAAAATARLNQSLLDPQLLNEDELARALAPALEADNTTADAVSGAQGEVSPVPIPNATQPWGELYVNSGLQNQMVSNDLTSGPIAPGPIAPGPIALNKGGFRLDTQNGGKAKHLRARFEPDRRKEVQAVRKIGACIRCRILRKTCSTGHPCDACRKVLSPRVWTSGCVRTKFTEQLDLYSAGVQIVLCQQRINEIRNSFNLSNKGVVIEASLPSDSGKVITVEVFQIESAKSTHVGDWTMAAVAMLDNDKEDVPGKVELYMREMLEELIRKEPSHFMRVTLETAVRVAQDAQDDNLIMKALELWGLVELLDKERLWAISVKPPTPDLEPISINAVTDEVAYSTICLQLTSAVERKAAATSKKLLTGMQRILQDSKKKVGFSMFFTTMVLLNCIEKTTWTFKAWEQSDLLHNWPLEKPPSKFLGQGKVIAELLRMLLAIRRALPQTGLRQSDGMLVVDEQDETIQAYFQNLNLTVAEVQAKQNAPFEPSQERSYDLKFCSILLLPGQD